ncbi:hypothetical protein BCR36DRAFT_369638 [Piromyces finnis]|uniref:Uncharacterized protein n=1 Tax=Piromyces finnis TaxID=1754191 RepID=A0A1Y1VCS3_9FUNG|nr:hypothetical protein BCR36DRAFT_369638 [Piromyces finnis]|eukprot:ORX52262.1 hypothetical protein BCR36DRAFT_369638 [Piromyces finnis]
MNSSIINSKLIEKDGSESNSNLLNSVKLKPINEMQIISNKLTNDYSLKKIKSSKENSLSKVNILEKKNDWLVSKKDSERTIINKDSCSSLYLFEQNKQSKFLEEEISNSITSEKPQLKHSETLINEDIIKFGDSKNHEPIIHSETLVNNEIVETTEKDDSTTVTHSETLVNKHNYKNFIKYQTNQSINSLESLCDFNPAVDEIINDSSVLTDSFEHFEMNQNENHINKNNLRIDKFDSFINISDDSLSYDNIFNYNSDIILSDDEDIRREKGKELYNEAIIMNNLDDNAFSFINEDSYNEYFDNSIDNSGSSNYSLFERDPNISHKTSDHPKSLKLLLHDDQEYTNLKSINKNVKLFNNLPLKIIYPDNINDTSNHKVKSPMNDNNDDHDDDFISVDDDAIYIVDNDTYPEKCDIQQELKIKKKVTFNENVKIKRIDRVDIMEDGTLKTYIKNEFKLGFKKLKNLFLGNNKKNNKTNINCGSELPVITIEYVDDDYDNYNKKEVLFFGNEYPKIVIDFTNEYDEVEVDDDYTEQYYNNYESNNESCKSNKYEINDETERDDDDHHNMKKDSIKFAILINDDTKAVKFAEVKEESKYINDENEEIPFYLRKVNSHKNKEKQRIAKKLIDKVMDMEKKYYLEQEKKILKYSNLMKDKKMIEPSKIPKRLEFSKDEENIESNSIEDQKSTQELTNFSNNDPILLKKSKSMNYIKTVCKTIRQSLSLADTSKNGSDDNNGNDKNNNDISNTGVYEPNVNNSSSNIINDDEGNGNKMDFYLFENNSESSINNDVKEEEENNNNFIDNRLEKVQSSLTTVIGGEDLEKIDVLVDNNEKKEEKFLKKKNTNFFFSMFKKKNSHSISQAHHIDINSTDNNNLIKNKKTNSFSYFSLFKNNFIIKSKNTSEKKEIVKTSNEEKSIQQEIENDQVISFEKMNSSLTETDIFAKQISKISSSFEINNSSTVNYTRSSLNHNGSEYINQQKNYNQNDDVINHEIETESSSAIDYHYYDNSDYLENNNIHHSSSQKIFKPVILPIDKENGFNKVETIEIIDEYIFDSPKPYIYYTNDGKEVEISEIIIEDRFME